MTETCPVEGYVESSIRNNHWIIRRVVQCERESTGDDLVERVEPGNIYNVWSIAWWIRLLVIRYGIPGIWEKKRAAHDARIHDCCRDSKWCKWAVSDFSWSGQFKVNRQFPRGICTRHDWLQFFTLWKEIYNTTLVIRYPYLTIHIRTKNVPPYLRLSWQDVWRRMTLFALGVNDQKK